MSRGLLRGHVAGLAVAGIVALSCRPSAPTSTSTPAQATSEAPRSGEATPAAATAPTPEAERMRELASNIGIVGASASAGFGASVPLMRALDVALRLDHHMHDVSSSAFFLRTDDIAEVELTAVRLRGTKLVIAVDFLLWFAYGVKTEAQRVDHLRKGLAMLEALPGERFVGDLPDVHGASRRMISPSQMPSPAQLVELNRMIHAWVARTEGVHLLPMAQWMHALKNEDPITLWGQPYEPRTSRLMQWDLLHPTRDGQAVLALLVLETVAEALGGLTADDVLVDPARVSELAGPVAEPSGETTLPAPPR